MSIDKGKTIILNLLVLSSLVLFWFLVNSQPKYEYLHPAEYLEPQPLGNKKEISELVKPQSIILHYGAGRYTGTSVDSAYYRIMMREMEKWYFFNLNTVNFTPEQWEQIFHERKAIEILFPTQIPMNMLAEMFTFRGKLDSIMEYTQRIIIYVDQSEKETYALFINPEGKEIVQARTAVTPKDLDQFYLSLGSSLQKMMVFPSNIGSYQLPVYLPKTVTTMKRYRYFYQPIPVFQMIQNLFIDPSLTRQVTERDGTVIYTDGSKSVQIPPDRLSVHFYDPLSESIEGSVKEYDFQSVIHFVNEHGGWNGNFILDELRNFPSLHEDKFVFRQYVGSYPLYGEKESGIGEISVSSNRSFIMEFHRSLLNLDSFFEHEEEQIMSGEDLLDRFTKLGIYMGDVTNIHLGYQAEMNQYHVTLQPKWIIKLNGKPPLIIDARKVGTQDGLEKSKNDSDYSLYSFGWILGLSIMDRERP